MMNKSKNICITPKVAKKMVNNWLYTNMENVLWLLLLFYTLFLSPTFIFNYREWYQYDYCKCFFIYTIYDY